MPGSRERVLRHSKKGDARFPGRGKKMQATNDIRTHIRTSINMRAPLIAR